MRQIILDTETTGLNVSEGHRLIEIGCLEMINRKLTGKRFHTYLNPEREVDAGALAVHGINNFFLKDKPVFAEIVADLINFIKDSELIIHNAVFDVNFINYELSLLKDNWKKVADYCQIIDTLEMARKRHVGQRNSLDALCKRYGIDNTSRDLHGALLDAQLLAQVYLSMTGGQDNFFDALLDKPQAETILKEPDTKIYRLNVLRATTDDLQAHECYLENMRAKGACIWPEEEMN
jgi:DNA polymerase III subunit epsilon